MLHGKMVNLHVTVLQRNTYAKKVTCHVEVQQFLSGNVERFSLHLI